LTAGALDVALDRRDRRRRQLLLGGGALGLTGCAYGATPIIAKLAYDEGIGVVTLTVMRCGSAGVLLVLACLLARVRCPRPMRAGAVPILVGCLVFTPTTFFYFAAFSQAPAGVAVMAVYTYPLLVAAVDYRAGGTARDHPGALVAALVLAITGLALVSGASLDLSHGVGIVLGLGSAVFYAAYVLLTERVVHGLGTTMTTTLVVLGATAGTLLYGLGSGELELQHSLAMWLVLIGQGALFALAIGAFVVAIRLLGSSVASIGDALTPSITIALAALVLGEAIGLAQLLGACLVVGGVGIAISARQ
jgi:drug/metabolite transporter (DMT)-like permease